MYNIQRGIYPRGIRGAVRHKNRLGLLPTDGSFYRWAERETSTFAIMRAFSGKIVIITRIPRIEFRTIKSSFER